MLPMWLSLFQLQEILLLLDANGNATPQQVDNGSSSAVGLVLEGSKV
jgi:hypothetical protein